MLIDFQGQVDKCKRRHLKNIKRYYYLFGLGTQARARGQGLASKVLRQWQDKAGAENLPIWLEATTAHSREIYARCGFQMVEEIVLGKRTHAASGVKEKGGPGVKLYAMLWEPKAAEK